MGHQKRTSRCMASVPFKSHTTSGGDFFIGCTGIRTVPLGAVDNHSHDYRTPS